MGDGNGKWKLQRERKPEKFRRIAREEEEEEQRYIRDQRHHINMPLMPAFISVSHDFGPLGFGLGLSSRSDPQERRVSRDPDPHINRPPGHRKSDTREFDHQRVSDHVCLDNAPIEWGIPRGGMRISKPHVKPEETPILTKSHPKETSSSRNIAKPPEPKLVNSRTQATPSTSNLATATDRVQKIDRTTQVSTITNNIGIQTAATKQSKIGTQTDFGMVIVPPAPILSVEMKQLIAEAALGEDKLDLIPEFIRCKCGHEDVVSNMFDCITCSEYGICSMCSMRNHRLHEISDSEVNVVHNVVNFCAEINREKLAKWAGDIGSLQNKSGQTFRKLCDLLGCSFKKAYENGNTRDIEALMEACDVSILKEHVINSMQANAKMLESADNLCDRLEKEILKSVL